MTKPKAEFELEKHLQKVDSCLLWLFFKNETLLRIKSGPKTPEYSKAQVQGVNKIEVWRRPINSDWFSFDYSLVKNPDGVWGTDPKRDKIEQSKRKELSPNE